MALFSAIDITIIGRLATLFAAIVSSFNRDINRYIFAAEAAYFSTDICLFEGLFGIYFIQTPGGATIITTIGGWFAPSAILSAITPEGIRIDPGFTGVLSRTVEPKMRYFVQ